MMRKLIWCSAAVSVLTAGGLYLAWQHARAHPDSLAGRCLISTSGAAIFLNPVAGVGPLLEHVLHHGDRTGGSEECVALAPGDEARWQADPVPVAPEGDAHEAMKLEVAGVMELPAAEPPAGPAPIVIPEDDVPPAAPIDENNNVTPVAAATIDIDPAMCPPVMPFCEDDRAPAPCHMPSADEGQEPAGAAQAAPACPKCGCMRAFLYVKNQCDNWAKCLRTAAEATETEEAKGDDGTPDCHHCPHHSGCPSNYCPYTGRTYPEPTAPAACPKKSHGGAEDSEPPAKHHPHKKCDEGEGCPAHPDVDTMEYRKSDGRLDDYGPGGPF